MPDARKARWVVTAWFGAAFLVVCGGLVLFPAIDLWASGLFYRTGEGFFLGDWPPFRFAHDELSVLVAAWAIVVVAILGASLLARRTILGLSARTALYLALALALGPGITVNTIFKDHWGRARPAQIAQFGGDKRFTPAFVPSDQCRRNCSFPAGDPSIGFTLVSFAFIAGTAAWRRIGIAGAIVAGTGLGVVRLAQGGHFLSDIVASGFFVVAICWALHRALIASDVGDRMLAALRRPSRGVQRFGLFTLAAAALFALSYLTIDVPLARLMAGTNPPLRGVFRIITQFGEGGVYLVPLGLAFLWAALTRRRRWARETGFLFAAVALSGIIADLMKPVFGRMRPALLLREDQFGFTWSGAHADHWSFPSGHSVTVAALGVALYGLYPRLWPLYAIGALLVMASRIVLDMHYLSDVVAGAYLGAAVTLALAAATREPRLHLDETQRYPLKPSSKRTV